MNIQISDKTILKLIRNQHAKELFELASTNREHLGEWLPWVHRMNSVEFMEQFIEGCLGRNKRGEEYAFVIFEKEQMVGRIGVYKIDQYNRVGEIGYWIGQDFEGLGITSKCSSEMVRFCFEELGLNRIEIRCAAQNLKSQAIPKRLGFKHEGRLRQAELLHGKFVDHELFSLLRSDA